MSVKKNKREIKGEKFKKEEDEKRIFAFLTTFLSIIGFIIVLIIKRDDKYVMFYAKQSLVIFVLVLITGALTEIIGGIPILGGVIVIGLNILIFVVWILSWVNALSGEKREIPVVSYWAKKVEL